MISLVMGRPIRIEYSGALYHIISRGNEKSAIFTDDPDRFVFLKMLKEYHERFGILIHSYVLMDNHYHLILETPLGNLLKVMHGLNGRYTGYYNRRHSRVGHLFQGRYKGIIVDKDEYLVSLSRYIHLNPVRAGIVDKPEDYKWSSYLGFILTAKEEPWLEYSWVLSKFGFIGKSAKADYQKFVNQGMDKEDEKLNDLYRTTILGGEKFTATIKKMVNAQQINEEITGRERLMDMPKPDVILKAVSLYFDKDEFFVKKSGRNNIARKIAIYLIKSYSGLGNKEIGELFGGIHYSAVSKIYSRVEEGILKDNILVKYIGDIMSHVKT
ncbi:MAG: transposase [Nitrospirae bacterium]|nr:transposase [Nitrospirota bacterium]